MKLKFFLFSIFAGIFLTITACAQSNCCDLPVSNPNFDYLKKGIENAWNNSHLKGWNFNKKLSHELLAYSIKSEDWRYSTRESSSVNGVKVNIKIRTIIIRCVWKKISEKANEPCNIGNYELYQDYNYDKMEWDTQLHILSGGDIFSRKKVICPK